MNKFTIPVYRPALHGNEKKYVDECLDSTWISSKGKYVQKFEDNFAKYTGVKYAVSVCNGTVALHTALLALDIGPGDEVIVPTLTYIASVNSITYTGATPVFVDSLKDTWQVDPEDVLRKISSRTKAILAVHLYGHPCDLYQLGQIAKKNHLFLIEDCAEAIGSLYKGKHVGNFGNIATFSFFGNKTITTGEGGMVTTNNKILAAKTSHLKGQGLAKNREYWHDIIGYNYRMTNICAAIGLAQLEQINKLIAKKIKIAHWYIQGLRGTPAIVQPETGPVRHSYWMVSILVDKPSQRNLLRQALAKAGIETRPLFYPIHMMPMYRAKRFPVAEDLNQRGITLPSFPDLTHRDVQKICAVIKGFFNAKNC